MEDVWQVDLWAPCLLSHQCCCTSAKPKSLCHHIPPCFHQHSHASTYEVPNVQCRHSLLPRFSSQTWASSDSVQPQVTASSSSRRWWQQTLNSSECPPVHRTQTRVSSLETPSSREARHLLVHCYHRWSRAVLRNGRSATSIRGTVPNWYHSLVLPALLLVCISCLTLLNSLWRDFFQL